MAVANARALLSRAALGFSGCWLRQTVDGSSARAFGLGKHHGAARRWLSGPAIGGQCCSGRAAMLRSRADVSSHPQQQHYGGLARWLRGLNSRRTISTTALSFSSSIRIGQIAAGARLAPMRLRLQAVLSQRPLALATASSTGAAMGSWWMLRSAAAMFLTQADCAEAEHAPQQVDGSAFESKSAGAIPTPKKSWIGYLWGGVLYVWYSVLDVVRVAQLFVIFAPLVCTLPLAVIISKVMPVAYDWWWAWLIWSIELCGPAFIKGSQWASTRADLFSLDMCDRLGVLHDQARTHSWKHTKRVLKTAFGDDWADRLIVDKKPIGSGCVAQVHKATMVIDEGKHRTVAVKVLHPHIRRVVRQDLRLMAHIAYLLDCIPGLHWLSFPACVDEFSKLMDRQMDMRAEAAAMQRFADNFHELPFVSFPCLIDGLVHEDVLVESFEHGTPISKFLDSGCPKKVRQEVGRLAMDAFIKMVFEHNYVHGDLHPGNILVTGVDPTGKASGAIRLTILDFGIVTELSDQDSINLNDLFLQVALGHGREAGRLIFERARRTECEDPEAFMAAMGDLVDRVHANKRHLSKLKAGELLRTVMRLCCEHKIQLESNFTSIVVAVVVLEGVARSLNPDLDLLRFARPVLEQGARKWLWRSVKGQPQ